MPAQPHQLQDLPDRDAALLAFFLGPVQPFIASARTVRDLWTGSYLLSWLTFAAMKPILTRHGPRSLVSPFVEETPLLLAFYGELPRERRRNALIASLPNHFEAKVPALGAADLAKACRASCLEEWKRIAEKVQRQLNETFHKHCPEWAQNWQQQIDTFFEMKTAVLPLAECGAAVLGTLLHPRPSDDFAAQMALLNTLRDANRAVRHVPAYRPRPDASGQFPGKCSLLGTLEQVGPADLADSARFWGEQLKTWKNKGSAGSRVGKNERLCAVSLVKRFAWPEYLADALKLDVRAGRFADTATLAATPWLQGDTDKKTPEIDPVKVRADHDTWSGQWLHWRSPHQDENEDECPAEVWSAVCRKRETQGSPPTYYAILMMDGDELNRHLRGEIGGWERGAARFAAISGRLAAFALNDASKIVEHDFHGELIYSGGDDTLALLPTSEVVACARALERAYRADDRMGRSAKTSAGIVVVHYKDDLRFAMEQARRAEHLAKEAGRSALTLSVCRRSGEHTTAVMGWEQADRFDGLVCRFSGENGASDRWAYKLRAELPTLRGLQWGAFTAEVKRLLGRIEGVAREQRQSFPDEVLEFLAAYHDEMSVRVDSRGCHRADEQVMDEFVTLCQSASFLARGKESR